MSKHKVADSIALTSNHLVGCTYYAVSAVFKQLAIANLAMTWNMQYGHETSASQWQINHEGFQISVQNEKGTLDTQQNRPTAQAHVPEDSFFGVPILPGLIRSVLLFFSTCLISAVLQVLRISCKKSHDQVIFAKTLPSVIRIMAYKSLMCKVTVVKARSLSSFET